MKEENMKIVSKLFVVENNRNKAVAEVVEGCGCGFEYLVRIEKEYVYSLPIFAKCMSICGIPDNEINIDKDFIEQSLKREFIYTHEEIALVVDKIL